jgi:hypothetical protein
VIHSLIGGALVVEGAKLTEDHILPQLMGTSAKSLGQGQPAMQGVQGTHPVYAAPYNWELEMAMRQVRGYGQPMS